jgi:predicted kinase
MVFVRLELIVLMGLQGSGKTTFRQRHFDATHVVVSKDLMPNNRRPERRQTELVTSALRAGQSVVVDNTNPRAADRAALVAIARGCGAKCIGYYFPCTTQFALARNGSRTGRARVPDVGIFATAKALEPPHAAEGFDELYRVRVEGVDAPVVERIVEEIDAE